MQILLKNNTLGMPKTYHEGPIQKDNRKNKKKFLNYINQINVTIRPEKNIQKTHFVGCRSLENAYYEISYTSYYILTSSILNTLY